MSNTPKEPKGITYSVVIPVYNEEGSVLELHREVKAVLQELEKPYEIIFVNDGSTDQTGALLSDLAQNDAETRYFSFTTNFGKAAAYNAGFHAIRGQFVITLDGDLQDDPHEIPRMLETLHEGFDLVVGWKQGRFDNEPLKAMPSRVFNRIKTSLFGLKLHDSNCGFRVMRRAVAKSLHLHGDHYRFIPELSVLAGFRVTECKVNHRKRKYGVSKYGPKRFWTGLLDLLTVRFITAFKYRPLHFFGTVGLVPFTLGFLLEMWALLNKLMGSTFQTHVAAIVVGATLITVGFQSILIGLIGEMLSQQFRDTNYVLEQEED
ncbi:MAG: glycosyltransferase [Deltaproteobacteria bacterium]|nr:MAG: glycosyltransferase [Deltaproteobacteria bacterium]